jgi:hypothetical protein
MSYLMQRNFFKTDEEVEHESRISLIKESLDKVRKGTYARLNVHERLLEDVLRRLEIFESNVCKGGMSDDKNR